MANSPAATITIAGPEAKLYVKLSHKPAMADSTPTKLDKPSITCNLSVHKKAVAAGVINIATTKMMPTVCKADTVTSVSTNINA